MSSYTLITTERVGQVGKLSLLLLIIALHEIKKNYKLKMYNSQVITDCTERDDMVVFAV